MIRYFLLISNIDNINLYIAGIETYLHYLALYISQKYFSILKSAFYIKKSVVGQVIIHDYLRKKSDDYYLEYKVQLSYEQNL